MDELNDVIKKALHFVHVVQQCCDQQRCTLERHFKTEIGSQAEAREAPNAETILLTSGAQDGEDEIFTSEHIETIKDESEDSDAEALALADKLLKKAKHIRQKYKMKNLPSSSNGPGEESTSSLNDHKKNNSTNQVKYVSECKVRQSHSAPLMSKDSAKTCRIDSLKESKSTRTRFPSESNIPVRVSKKIISLNGNKCTANSDHATEETCKVYKNMKFEHISSVEKSKIISRPQQSTVPKYSKTHLVKKASVAIGNIEESNKNRLPKMSSVKTVKAARGAQKILPSWRSVLPDSCDTKFKNIHKFDFLPCFWYPFIISENKTRLITHIVYSNQEEFKRILILCYKIQEAMFWLDFFSIFGRDVAPSLQNLNQSDQKVTLIISYLQGLFHRNLQRIPVIVSEAESLPTLAVCKQDVCQDISK